MTNHNLNLIKGELELIRIRRQEIAAMEHPSRCRSEYINLMRREQELLDAIEFKFMNYAAHKAVFMPNAYQ